MEWIEQKAIAVICFRKGILSTLPPAYEKAKF